MIEWMKTHNVPFAYYVDDNFWELKGDTPLAQFYQSAPVRHTLDLSITDARTVIVNAPRLGQYIKSRYPTANIMLLNAPFDFSLTEELPRREKSAHEIRVGFAGSITRADDFVEILPALKRLRDRFRNVTFTFFGYCPPELMGSERVTYVPHVANYSEFIRLKASHQLDIGLAPMAASAANLYKTNNKYREYGALEIAGVYTNTSPYTECVVDGETGLLVSHSSDAWYDALERLVLDRELRARIAAAAYEDIKTNYAQRVVAEQWRLFLESFARDYSTSDPWETATPITVAGIRARRWFAQLRIRVLVRMAGVRRRARGLVHRISGERGQ
jgi:glycosyltransferase involved in cell wall biosynthesis